MKLWRLCKARYAATAFSGEGTRLYSGRWNPAGVSMVYTSISLALASIEYFVHLDPGDAPDDLVSISATLTADIALERIEIDGLPADWRAVDHPHLQQLGADWIRSQRSVAWQVPSVAVEGEWNVLLNPAHRDFANITVDAPRAFRFDHRMFKVISGAQ